MSENTTNINNRLTVRKAAVDPATIIDSDYLFSLQPYIEGGNLDGALNLTNGNKGNYTIETIDDVDAPYGKVVKFPTGQQSFVAAYDIDVPVKPGDKLYIEATYMIPATDTGTESRFYLGFNGLDKDKKVTSSNNGLWQYVVGNITLAADGNWHTVGGYTTVPSSHTPYNGSDGGAIRYMKNYVLVNYGAGDREVYLSNLKVRKVETNNDEGDTAFKGDVGIGTDNPSAKLHVVGSGNSSGTKALLIENSDGADLVKVLDDGTFFMSKGSSGATPISQQMLIVEDNSATGIGILTPNSTSGYLFFGDNNNAQVGYISYAHSDDKMAFKVNGSHRLEILSTGQLQLNSYIGTNFDSLFPNAILGVDASGNVVKSSISNLIQATDDRDMAPEDVSYDVDFKIFFSSKNGLDTGTTTDSNYQDVIYLNTWSDASGGDANILAFDKSEMKIYHYQADQADTNWGTPKTLAYAEDVLTSTPTLSEVITQGSTYNGSAVISIVTDDSMTLTANDMFINATNVLTIDGTININSNAFTIDAGSLMTLGTTDAEIDITASATAADTDADITISNTATGTNGKADIVIEAQDKLKLRGGNVMMPTWAGDGQRPTATGLTEAGTFGFNVTRNTIEVYNGSAWVQMS